MNYLEDKVLLIIPCYNEEMRIDFQRFISAPSNHYFLFANDGSTDGTSALVSKHLSNNIMLLDLMPNKGKAEAVRQGFLHAQSLPLFNEIDWIGYWDADLSIPLTEVSKYLLYLQDFYPDHEAVLGSRVLRLGSTIDRNMVRHIFGRSLATIISELFKLSSYDTQCGAKLFRKELAFKISEKPFISKWIFDVEVILRLKGHKLVEYPLPVCLHVEGSKLKPIRELFRTFRDIYLIKKAY